MSDVQQAVELARKNLAALRRDLVSNERRFPEVAALIAVLDIGVKGFEAALADTERERDEARAFADATNLPNHERVLHFADTREREFKERVVVAEARVAELEAKLRSAYAYRETMEGLPPGTLTDKLPVESR